MMHRLKPHFGILLIIGFLFVPGFANAQLGPSEPSPGKLDINFLKYPAGNSVENPVLWEFYTAGKTKIDYYEIVGNIGNTAYKSWTRLSEKPLNPDKEDRFGYVLMQMNKDSLLPGSISRIQFRACVENLFSPICDSQGSESEMFTWTMAASANQEASLDFISVETADNEYSFQDEDTIEISSNVISAFIVSAVAAENNEVEKVRLTKKDGIQLQGGPQEFSRDANDQWFISNQLLNDNYYNHSLTVELVESDGEILEKTALLKYVPPVHLDIKTHTNSLGGLTPAQAAIERGGLSEVQYEIDLNASAAQGLVADYYMWDESSPGPERYKLMTSKLVNIDANEDGTEGVFVPNRSSVMQNIFHFSPTDTEYDDVYMIEWRGRVRFSEDDCTSEYCDYQFQLTDPSVWEDIVEVYLIDTGASATPLIKFPETESNAVSLKTNQWYGFRVKYNAASEENSYLSLGYTVDEGNPKALTNKQLGSSILGISKYIDRHELEIALSKEQVMKYEDESGNPLAPEIFVTPAGSKQKYKLMDSQFTISPASADLLSPDNSTQQVITISLNALSDMGYRVLEVGPYGIPEAFNTAVPVGQDLRIEFEAVAARAYEFSDIDPEKDTGSSSHFEMQSLVALELDPVSRDHTLIDKAFKAPATAGLIVINKENNPDELYYQAVVGPQLDTSSVHSKGQANTSYFYSPFSVRPRSLLNVDIPNLYINKRFIAGQGTFFNDHNAQYKDADFKSLYQILDNTGEVPTYAKISISPAKKAEIVELLGGAESDDLLVEGICKPSDTNCTLDEFLTLVDQNDESDPVIPIEILNNRNLAAGPMGAHIFYTVSEMMDLSQVTFADYVPAANSLLPLLPHTGGLIIDTQGLGEVFSLSNKGALAFGLTPADSQVACGTEETFNCVRAFVSAQMVVADYTIDLGSFMIYFTVDPGAPTTTPSEVPDEGSHIELE
ncbi:MAG: hypothetical protein PHU71_01110 [Candidatus Gracilibacteria bacterium]|nr:hypothetical protein [Candidatus Gracilibacteria bacterium]